jgi:hypothetical protein
MHVGVYDVAAASPATDATTTACSAGAGGAGAYAAHAVIADEIMMAWEGGSGGEDVGV